MAEVNVKIDKVFTDKIEFFKWVTGYKPYDYQVEFLKCEDRYVAACWARQVGKSAACATLILFEAITKPNQEILIIAPFKEEANILFNKVVDCINSQDYLKRICEYTKTEITVDNGSRVKFFTAGKAGKSIKGHSPNWVFMDEADGLPDDAVDTLEPSIMVSKGRWTMVSTPWFPPCGSRFYEAVKNKNGNWKVFHIKASQCPSYDKKKLEQMRREKPEEIFKGEYEADIDVGRGLSQYFAPELVTKCAVEGMEEVCGPTANREYILAVDLASMGNDQSVFMVGEVHGNSIRVVKIISTAKKPTLDSIARIKDLHYIFDFSAIYVDERGIGTTTCEILEGDGLPVVPVSFTLTERHKSFAHLKYMMETGLICYPLNGQLMKEMISMIPKATVLGFSIQPPPRGHDDFVSALILLARHTMWSDDEGGGEERGFYFRAS